MEKNRLEAFSDGVLAIVITIMILELKQPLGDGWGDFRALAPTLLTYLLSYVFLAIYWVNHHQIFHDAGRINVGILWCNIAWLFTLSFIPFLTAWVGNWPASYVPLCLYFGDMTLACIAFHLMYYLIFRSTHPGGKFRLEIRSIASLAVYAAAAALGGLCPAAAYIAVAAVSLWWIVPIRKHGKKGTEETGTSS